VNQHQFQPHPRQASRSRWLGFWTLVALCIVWFVPARAGATEVKTYPGSMCVPISSNEDSNEAARLGTANASAQHLSGTEVIVACPILKTVTTSSKLEKVDIELDWPSTQGQVTCQLQMYRSAYNTYFGPFPTVPLATQTVSAIAQSYSDNIVFANFADNGEVPWRNQDWLTYQLRCTLKGNAIIRSYEVREAGTKDSTRKTYPASMCRPGDNMTGGYFSQGHFVEARGTEGEQFVMSCPIVTDVMGNTSGLTVAQLAVGPPVTAGRTLTCQLRAYGLYGAQVSAGAPVVISSGPSSTSLTVNLSVTTSPEWASYSIYCSGDGLGDARIIGYRIEES
jgi:hypothetical protein